MAPKGKKKAAPTPKVNTPAPQFITDDIKLLFSDLSNPETQVRFNTAVRADTTTIQNNINPPQITWTWANSAGRLAQKNIGQSNLGNFGIQTDVNILYKLTGINPTVWEIVQIGPDITWNTWANSGDRLKEDVKQDDVGKFGVQSDIGILYKLAGVNPTVWQPVPTLQGVDPTGTSISTTIPTGTTNSSPIEMSTGASDADSYHDFFRLQIAFEDVWAELLNTRIQNLGEQLYAQWDARMNPTLDDTGATDKLKTFYYIRLKENLPVIATDAGIDALALDGTILVFNNVRFQIKSFTNDPSQFVGNGTDVNPYRVWLSTTTKSTVGNILNVVSNAKYPNGNNLTDDWKFELDNADPTRINITPADPTAENLTDCFITHWGDNNSIDTSSDAGISGVEELKDFIGFLKNQLNTENTNASPFELSLAHNLADTLTICKDLLAWLAWLGDGFIWQYDHWLGMDPVGNPSWNGSPNGWTNADERGLTRIDFLNRVIGNVQHLSSSTSSNLQPQDFAFTELKNLLNKLDGMLNEKYRFDIFAPDSINYGLLLNYRQHWVPQSYQVGNLVSTIPLAPQEVRKYTTKTVVKKTRNVKEIDDSLRSGKDESSVTSRVDAEIVQKAKNQTNFQTNASGSFGNDNLYKVNASLQKGQEDGTESAQTKREFHESVIKSSQEYRNEHRMEISTEESREDESTSYREIRNPNDELTVTYLFYELQRRYMVDEALHKVTPVILVAQDVPAPHEVDEPWLLRYDWIIKRTILDDSFLPALEYLSANYTGADVSLQVLRQSVEDQRAVVAKVAGQVLMATDALNAATVGLVNAENQSVSDERQKEQVSLVKSFFDPLGITKTGTTDGNADRAEVDYAKDALQRAKEKADELKAQLRTETTALHAAIDKYTKAATEHFNMLAEIDRLRIHVKDNIIYYMQAIWTYEPADQRYFRLYNIDVPVFTHNTNVVASKSPADSAKGAVAQLDSSSTTYMIDLSAALPNIALKEDGKLNTLKLHQVADIDKFLGFKGNYMIFPMTNFNYLQWFLMANYISVDNNGTWAIDPDHLAGWSVQDLEAKLNTFFKAQNADKFAAVEPQFREILKRLLSEDRPEMVIVPSNSLYIEALPGTHPLLEDFKLIHRAIDVKKAQAEARHAELENLRVASRILENELGDPDIDKVIVVEGGQNVTVDAGQ